MRVRSSAAVEFRSSAQGGVAVEEGGRVHPPHHALDRPAVGGSMRMLEAALSLSLSLSLSLTL